MVYLLLESLSVFAILLICLARKAYQLQISFIRSSGLISFNDAYIDEPGFVHPLC